MAEKKKKLAPGRHVSAIKRALQNEKKKIHNRAIRSEFRLAMRKVKEAVATNDKTQATVTLGKASSSLDKAAKRNLIHRKFASRHISRLTKLVQKVAV